jgi:hypothetical protein
MESIKISELNEEIKKRHPELPPEMVDQLFNIVVLHLFQG